MNGAVVEMLKKIADMSNVNLVKNTDDLLSKKNADVSVEWIRKTKTASKQIQNIQLSFFQFLKIKLIPEVWSLIFSFLSYDDLIGASAVCKCFYYLSQNNDGFVKKLSDLRALFSGVNVYEHC